ncbi:hypothetical protein EXN66_Car002619 [Channa argus]|uniref:Secreted protein n=1 Tax=Channa argus TaxID=215402 RepID=A0A6G1P9M5_CHAAH|nr:hypothetical protein EXN66_Car002619 [Channa argus]
MLPRPWSSFLVEWTLPLAMLLWLAQFLSQRQGLLFVLSLCPICLSCPCSPRSCSGVEDSNRSPSSCSGAEVGSLSSGSSSCLSGSGAEVGSLSSCSGSWPPAFCQSSSSSPGGVQPLQVASS